MSEKIAQLPLPFARQRLVLPVRRFEIQEARLQLDEVDRRPTTTAGGVREEWLAEYDAKVIDLQSYSLRILVWGPGASYPDLYKKRCDIRDRLNARGHRAFFSEDWPQPDLETLANLTPHDKELPQAQGADLIVSLYASPGSIAEVHDFVHVPGIERKMLIFIQEKLKDSYGARSLLSSPIFQPLRRTFSDEDIRDCYLMHRVIEIVEEKQKEKWRLAERAFS